MFTSVKEIIQEIFDDNPGMSDEDLFDIFWDSFGETYKISFSQFVIILRDLS